MVSPTPLIIGADRFSSTPARLTASIGAPKFQEAAAGVFSQTQYSGGIKGQIAIYPLVVVAIVNWARLPTSKFETNGHTPSPS
ncbi:unnamed protein product [Parascedosporium putredinis]|uniref:Uncharacterized protein n=1 Tax=Parascedosporium putredinis TaxID=1442378 RepID=A0A9P1H4M2_9PEZI|nr:unnamed protein product [Parascedosporium putredinis]CAI7996882.1 unnamed protein product [Parascedosporium putredinis]